MQIDLMNTLVQLAGSFNLNVCRLSPGGEPEGQFDGGIRAWMEPGFDEKGYLLAVAEGLERGLLYHLADRFGCRFLFLKAEEGLFSFGPYLDAPNTRAAAEALWRKLGGTEADGEGVDSLFEYRSTLPVVADEGALIRAFQRIAAPLGKGEPLPLRAWEEPSGLSAARPSVNPEERRQERYEQSMAASMIERRYRAENAWLDEVLTGDTEKAMAAMRELARYQLPGRFDSLRGRQNLLIILNTLLRKDIERAGIHPAFIDEISREYSRRIEGCISLRELGALRAEMVSAYCRLVREAEARGYSPLIQGVMGDGLLHLDGDASPRTLALRAGVSESYLATRFKAEVGMTLSRWLRLKRIGRAKELLEREDLSASQVAEQVGILDVSYFIRLFKRETGMTPGEYRARLRQEKNGGGKS